MVVCDYDVLAVKVIGKSGTEDLFIDGLVEYGGCWLDVFNDYNRWRNRQVYL
jgi:hypothetical protein